MDHNTVYFKGPDGLNYPITEVGPTTISYNVPSSAVQRALNPSTPHPVPMATPGPDGRPIHEWIASTGRWETPDEFVVIDPYTGQKVLLGHRNDFWFNIDILVKHWGQAVLENNFKPPYDVLNVRDTSVSTSGFKFGMPDPNSPAQIERMKQMNNRPFWSWFFGSEPPAIVSQGGDGSDLTYGEARGPNVGAAFNDLGERVFNATKAGANAAATVLELMPYVFVVIGGVLVLQLVSGVRQAFGK